MPLLTPTPDAEPPNEIPVDNTNEYLVGSRENLPNHSESKAGRGRFVCISAPRAVVLRTKQAAYRLCAYILTLAEHLPDEEGSHTLDQVIDAVRNPQRHT